MSSNKNITIYNLLEIKLYKNKILKNLKRGHDTIKSFVETNDALSVFKKIKYEKMTVDPFAEERETFYDMEFSENVETIMKLNIQT